MMFAGLFTACLAVLCLHVNAQTLNTQNTQDSTVQKKETPAKPYKPFNVNLQVRNIYIWRGFRVSNAPISDIDVHYLSKDGSFQAGFWGGAGFDGTYKEFDYYLKYTKGGFSAAIWDINNFTDFPNAGLFDYKRSTTSHFVDVGVAYSFNMKLPLTVSWNTIVAGRDTYVKENGDRANAYSNYVQLDQVLWKQADYNLHVFVGGGFAFGREQNFYGNKPNVVNAGFTLNKDLVIFSYHMPVSATVMFNPEKKIGGLQLVANLF
ncbi:MAG TPA: hypothetical protein VJ720_15290, partial [Chitinophaga sp.]|nr:hypothetical protein [Chitinophaga sp.]